MKRYEEETGFQSTTAKFTTKVPVIRLSGSFDAQIRDLDRALEGVVEMQEFMQELDYGRMEQILQEGAED